MFGFLGHVQAQVTTARIESIQFSSAYGMEVPMAGDGSDGNDFTSNYTPPDYGTTLWLEITNVSNGLAYLNLNNATDSVYEIFSKPTCPSQTGISSRKSGRPIRW